MSQVVKKSEEEKEIKNAKKRAIKAAWKEEKEAVLQGKGSRDWTPEQQKQIVEKGKLHSFAGHHMRSVSSGKTHEEKIAIAEDKNDIQFLDTSPSNNEHFAAHNKNTRNRTNGYYDVKTGRTKSFGEKAPDPPRRTELSHPVYNQENKKEQYDEYGVKIDSGEKMQEQTNKQEMRRGYQ